MDSPGDFGFVVPFDESRANNPQQTSLQQSFLDYKKRRQAAVETARVSREAAIRDTHTAEYKQKLREKFVGQAKKYFGVPYARRYWSEDEAEYNSQLFLDCCGLVRKIVRDLKDDFGFEFGPWNQAYQYDTLPIRVEHEADMLPGDLVFISATYYNPKCKRQKHDIVHVEIWLGEGEKTIGARWQRGHVEIHKSYKFEARSYHSPTYIFKSIDTWLSGECKSHCDAHPWKLTHHFIPSEKSIFFTHKPEQTDTSTSCPPDEDASGTESEDEGWPLPAQHAFSDGTQTRENTVGTRTRENTVGTQTRENTVGTQTRENTVGTQTRKSTVGTQTRENTVGTQTRESTVGTQTRESTVGTQTRESTVGTQTRESTVGTQTRESTVGTQTRESTVGTQTRESTVETQTRESTVGTQTRENTVGTQTRESTVGTQTRESTVGTQTRESTVGTQTRESTVGTQTRESTVGTQTRESTVGTQTRESTVGTQTRESTVGTQTREIIL